jgi:hypothetical protein
MNDFQQLWDEEVVDSDKVPEKYEKTKEYQLRDACARYRIFSNIMQIYFSEKHGEKIITETFKTPDPLNIEFHLK